MLRELVKIDQGIKRVPDETTILRSRHLLARHNLAQGMLSLVDDTLGAMGLLLRTGKAVDATLIAAPNSTHSADGERDLEMHKADKATSGNPA